MSRTRHHHNQRRRHCGEDFWSRYKCNRHGANGTGPYPKHLADSERRTEGKESVKKELHDTTPQE